MLFGHFGFMQIVYNPKMVYCAATATIHWVISECHSHPLSFFVAFANIQHQWSLSFVTVCQPAATWESVHAVLVIETRGYP